MDGEGNILVADGNNNRIQKFTAEGRFIISVDIKGNGHPRGITFNAINNKVYLVDVLNH